MGSIRNAVFLKSRFLEVTVITLKRQQSSESFELDYQLAKRTFPELVLTPAAGAQHAFRDCMGGL
jgi:hypothetical protein